jgi:hypothetical protein
MLLLCTRHWSIQTWALNSLPTQDMTLQQGKRKKRTYCQMSTNTCSYILRRVSSLSVGLQGIKEDDLEKVGGDSQGTVLQILTSLLGDTNHPKCLGNCQEGRLWSETHWRRFTSNGTWTETRKPEHRLILLRLFTLSPHMYRKPPTLGWQSCMVLVQDGLMKWIPSIFLKSTK